MGWQQYVDCFTPELGHIFMYAWDWSYMHFVILHVCSQDGEGHGNDDDGNYHHHHYY